MIRCALLIWVAALAGFSARPLAAQQRIIGAEAAAIELRYATLTGGVGLRAGYAHPVGIGHLRASAAYHRFHEVGNHKPALDLVGLDVDVVFFRRFPVHPYIGIGAGVIRFDADNVTEPVCNFDECLAPFEDETSLFLRPTILGLQVDVTKRFDLRAAVQMVVRKQHPTNGTSAQALFVVGADYRF